MRSSTCLTPYRRMVLARTTAKLCPLPRGQRAYSQQGGSDEEGVRRIHPKNIFMFKNPGAGSWPPGSGCALPLEGRGHKFDVHFRLKCGCVLHSRIKIVQGDDSIAAATHGRVYHLEAGDRIEMQFWLLVSRNIYPTCWCKDRNAAHDTCALGEGGGSKARTVRLDQTSEEEEPKRIFSSAPRIKFTLVGVKPNGDNDIDHVPLSLCQLPGHTLCTH
jgi:hypothetical protein